MIGIYIILALLGATIILGAIVKSILENDEKEFITQRFIQCNKCKGTIDKHKNIHYRQKGRYRHMNNYGVNGNSKYHILCRKCYNKRHINHEKVRVVRHEK